jgi:hypothetical protein
MGLALRVSASDMEANPIQRSASMLSRRSIGWTIVRPTGFEILTFSLILVCLGVVSQRPDSQSRSSAAPWLIFRLEVDVEVEDHKISTCLLYPYADLALKGPCGSVLL